MKKITDKLTVSASNEIFKTWTFRISRKRIELLNKDPRKRDRELLMHLNWFKFSIYCEYMEY